LQPLAQQFEHATVRHPLVDHREQPLVVDRAEEVRDVGLEGKDPALGERDADDLQGVGGRALGPEPKRAGEQVGLEEWLEDDLGCLLAHPVCNSRDAQRSS
jgi:hypothetical protein